MARRAVARIVPSGATTPPATFVPPMSMPSAASPAASRAVTRCRSAGRRAGRRPPRSRRRPRRCRCVRAGLGEGPQGGRRRRQDVGEGRGDLRPLAADHRGDLADGAPAAVGGVLALGSGGRVEAVAQGLEEPSSLLDPVGTGVHEVLPWGHGLSGEEVGGPELRVGAEADDEAGVGRAGVDEPAAGHLAPAQQRVEPDRPAGVAHADHEVVEPAGQPQRRRARRRAAARSAARPPRCARRRAPRARSPRAASKPSSSPTRSSTSAGATAASATRCSGAILARSARTASCSAARRVDHSPVSSSGSTRVSSEPVARPCRASVVTAARRRRDRRRAAARRPGRRRRRVGEPVAGQQLLDDGHGRERGVDRPPLRRTGRDGGRAHGAERPHAGRHELVEPPAQRRRQGHERGHRLERTGVQDDEVGLGAGQLGEERELGGAGDRHHRAVGRQGQLRHEGADGAGRAAPEALGGGLRRPRGRRPDPGTSASPATGAACRDSRTVRRPERAERTAAAAASVEVPAPPGPVRRSVRTAGSALDALLELLESRVQDDLLRLALDHAEHRDGEVDGDRVA